MKIKGSQLLCGLMLVVWLDAQAVSLKIAVVGPFSGTSAADMYSILRGAQLAVEELNASGGIKGAKLTIIAVDDMANPKRAIKVADSLAKLKDVIAVVGHYNSSCTKAAAFIYNRSGLVAISPASTSPTIREAGEYIFRVCPSDIVIGDKLAKFVTNTMGVKRIIVIYDDENKGLKYFFTLGIKNNGAQILAEIPYKGKIDFIDTIKGLQPELIFLACTMSTAAEICIALRESDIDIPIVGGDDMMSSEFRKRTGRACEGVIYVTYINPELTSTKGFIRKYMNRYGENPSGWAALAYEATSAIIMALKNGNLTRKSVKEYLSKLGYSGSPIPGVSDTIMFDQYGDISRDIWIAQIINGEPTILHGKPVTLASIEAEKSTTMPVIETTAINIPLPVRPEIPLDEQVKAIEFAEHDKLPPEVPVDTMPEFIPYDKPPKLIYMPEPTYPEAARAAHIEGEVVLLVKIDTTGKVTGVKVVKSLHPLLDEEAIKVARRARFEPAMQRDKPVPVIINLRVNFKL